MGLALPNGECGVGQGKALQGAAPPLQLPAP